MSRPPLPSKDLVKGLIILGVSLEFMGTLLVSADWKLPGLVIAATGFTAVIIGYLRWK